ncbi:MAG: hypothetical protein ACRER1_01060 [Gammaproteobacteria bacterium]
MNGKVASSKALGFGIFAVGVWLFSMALSGLAVFHYGGQTHMISMFMGIGLLVAGVAAFLRNETWFAFFFILWSVASFATGGAYASGWMWLAMALINLYLWLAARNAKLETAIVVIAFLIGLDCLGQGLSRVAGLHLAGLIGAYIGLATAALAFYVSAVHVMCPDGCDRLPMMGGGKGSGGV